MAAPSPFHLYSLTCHFSDYLTGRDKWIGAIYRPPYITSLHYYGGYYWLKKYKSLTKAITTDIKYIRSYLELSDKAKV